MNFVIKLSKLCNLRCTYCYEYAELANKERMSLAGIEFLFRSIAQYAAEHPGVPIHLILHGGEPLLLPREYLRAVGKLRDEYLLKAGVQTKTSVQSNLYALPEATLDLLDELNLELGMSLDVFGDQRVDINGRNAQFKVMQNLQRVIDRRIPVGGISVLHALNADKVEKTYEFFNALNIDLRFLPCFASGDTGPRMQPLLMSHSRIVAALKRIVKRQFAESSRIDVYPIKDYLDTAIRTLTGVEIPPYDPADREWALIINTNGDTYSHGDAYTPAGYMGNVFRQTLGAIFASDEYAAVSAVRSERAQLCKSCAYYRHCDQLSVVEAIASERGRDPRGNPACAIAQPMIQFIVEEMSRSASAMNLLQLHASRPSPRSNAAEAMLI
jgi:uncharacterized protein